MERWAAAALWLLPLHALLLVVTTLTHEPDHTVDFGAWSEYVTTDVFLVSHVVGSILGGAVWLVGLMGAVLLLATGPRAEGAFAGTALLVVGNVVFTSVFGLAAFTQPAMGEAFLAGEGDMPGFYDDVYGTPMLTTFAIGALAWLVGSVVFGLAVAGSAPGLRWAGRAYAAAVFLFPVLGFTVSLLQPVAGAAAAVAGVVIARRLPVLPAAVSPGAHRSST